MQWRLAAAGIGNFFAFSLFSPVMFRYYGPAVAGRMGMSWQIVLGLWSFASAWIQAKVPTFGALIARREYSALDRLFFRTTGVSLAVLAVGASCLWAVVAALATLHPLAILDRVLAPLPFGLMLAAGVLLHLSSSQSAYLRAHKREPLLILNVVSSAGIGLLVWVLGSRLGPVGAASGFLLVVGGFMVPYETFIWVRCRAAWHAPSDATAALALNG